MLHLQAMVSDWKELNLFLACMIHLWYFNIAKLQFYLVPLLSLFFFFSWQLERIHMGILSKTASQETRLMHLCCVYTCLPSFLKNVYLLVIFIWIWEKSRFQVQTTVAFMFYGNKKEQIKSSATKRPASHVIRHQIPH